MNELTPAPQSAWEREYWEDIEARLQDQGVVIEGGIYNSRSYQDAIWNVGKGLRRAHNVSLATGRVNGQFIKHGNKRT